MVDYRLYSQRSLVAESGYAWWLSLNVGSIETHIFITGILTLNLFLIIPLLTSVANGLDSSLVNGQYVGFNYVYYVFSPLQTGLQILPDWKNYFNDPQGKALGMSRLPSRHTRFNMVFRAPHFRSVSRQSYRASIYTLCFRQIWS